MDQKQNTSLSLAAAITKAASKQTYYTIRFLVDREFVGDAYRAYGYFRWLDDILDIQGGTSAVPGEDEASKKMAFIKRQKELLQAYYRGDMPADLCAQERMLAELVGNDSGQNPGLKSYLYNMMAVMEFDSERRGRVISQAELSAYSQSLAAAVTDAMYYFIGHDDPAPRHEARYLAVTAAHIIHMLRDTREDIDNLYFNIPGEYLQAFRIAPGDVESKAYRQWVCSRVKLARRYFEASRGCIAEVKNLRCRLAGYAYTARFEWMLRAIERDNYCLRSEYRARKSLWTGLWMSWATLSAMIASLWVKGNARTMEIRSARIEDL